MIVKMEKPQHPSSNVDAIGFVENQPDVPGEPVGRGNLRVQFRDGTIGEYADVPRAVYNALMTAKSPGGFVHAQVKPHFQYRRLNLRYEVRLEIHEVEATDANAALQ